VLVAISLVVDCANGRIAPLTLSTSTSDVCLCFFLLFCVRVLFLFLVRMTMINRYLFFTFLCACVVFVFLVRMTMINRYLFLSLLRNVKNHESEGLKKKLLRFVSLLGKKNERLEIFSKNLVS